MFFACAFSFAHAMVRMFCAALTMCVIQSSIGFREDAAGIMDGEDTNELGDMTLTGIVPGFVKDREFALVEDGKKFVFKIVDEDDVVKLKSFRTNGPDDHGEGYEEEDWAACDIAGVESGVLVPVAAGEDVPLHNSVSACCVLVVLHLCFDMNGMPGLHVVVDVLRQRFVEQVAFHVAATAFKNQCDTFRHFPILRQNIPYQPLWVKLFCAWVSVRIRYRQ